MSRTRRGAGGRLRPPGLPVGLETFIERRVAAGAPAGPGRPAARTSSPAGGERRLGRRPTGRADRASAGSVGGGLDWTRGERDEPASERSLTQSRRATRDAARAPTDNGAATGSSYRATPQRCDVLAKRISGSSNVCPSNIFCTVVGRYFQQFNRTLSSSEMEILKTI